MMHHIIVEPSGRRFEAEPDETLLAAGIRQRIGLPYGCKDGACGSCKTKKISGSVRMQGYQPQALSEEEAAQGYVLTCCAHATSDVVLESRQVTHAGAFPIKKMPARVAALERLSPDVMRIQLQLPVNDLLEFHAGQYMDFILKNGDRRSYSLATAPHALLSSGVPMVDLHVRHMLGGKFTDHVFSTMKEKEILRIEGPYGSFHLRDNSPKPIIFVASGTGFAPIKAIIEHMQHKGITREVTLYWGGRRPHDLYMDEWIRTKTNEMPHLYYVPVISDTLPEDHWSGRTGFVHLAVLQDHPDLSGYQAYVCGVPIMVDSARKDFIQTAQLPENEFYADSFTSNSPT